MVRGASVRIGWDVQAGAAFDDGRRVSVSRLGSGARLLLLALPGALFVLVFLMLPLLSIVVFSFWRTESYQNDRRVEPRQLHHDPGRCAPT